MDHPSTELMAMLTQIFSGSGLKTRLKGHGCRHLFRDWVIRILNQPSCHPPDVMHSYKMSIHPQACHHHSKTVLGRRSPYRTTPLEVHHAQSYTPNFA